MADNAPQIQYRQEYISGFEQRQSLIRQTVTTEAVYKGNQATFLVADSDGATPVTRGLNGLIPARPDNLTQKVATLVEWHDLVRRSSFNIFSSQGDGRRIMQETSLGVINRKCDQDILGVLDGTTYATSLSTGAVASLELVMYAKTILGNNDVPMDGNISAVISPGFHAKLMSVPSFTSVDYINNKPFESDLVLFRWAGVNFVVHPNISGAGTNTEKCFMYHKSAIGHAVNTSDIDTAIGYDEEQDYSYARCSVDMGAVLLQPKGVVEVVHDGSGYAPAS